MNKEAVESYHFHKLGHFQYECPNWEEKANYSEDGEEEELCLLMVETETDCKEAEDGKGEALLLMAQTGCT